MAIKPIHLSALNGLLAVGLGAFGAHALKPALLAHDGVETWKTASLYHLVHAVALLAVALDADRRPGPALRPAARITFAAWLAGCALFSGSLYVMALGGPRWLGPVTPLGGAAFLLGWAALPWLRRPGGAAATDNAS